jgi:hypothetical protein
MESNENYGPVRGLSHDLRGSNAGTMTADFWPKIAHHSNNLPYYSIQPCPRCIPAGLLLMTMLQRYIWACFGPVIPPFISKLQEVTQVAIRRLGCWTIGPNYVVPLAG